MLEYRVNIDKTKKTNVNIPVSSISFYEEKNNANDDYTTYGSYNENQVLTTCTCHTLDKLANGSVINIMTILTSAYQGYTFNDKFKIFGLNKANKSFSFIYDKYYNLKPSTIIRRSDVAEDYFAGYDDYAKQIMLYLDSPHYFDTADYEKMEYRNDATGEIITEEEYNILSPEDKEKYYQIITQKIPIYFRYVKDNETVTETIEFSFYTFDSLITNLKAFEGHDYLYNKIFGESAYDDIGLKNDIIGTLNGITIFRDNFLFSDNANYTITFERPIIELDIPIKTTFENNLQQTDLLQTNFVDEEKKKAINKIVDLEKDVYYPVIKENDKYTDVYTIRFNLHFREHRGVNWLINNESSWNGVEYKPVNGVNEYKINDKITKSDSSDLLTFLDFNNEDVRYQKNKLKKSFLRLNIYDSTNPANQNLIGYSTVFFNCGKLFEKYAKYYETDGYIDIGYGENIGVYNVNTAVQKKGIRVNRDLFNSNENTFDESSRLSSQFVVQSKNSSTSSSEGFYIYLWKEDESETPQDLYMKVEFNHAGYGRTIPFMMPYWDKQKWGNDSDKKGIKTFEQIIEDWNSKKCIYINKNNPKDLKTEDEYLRLTPEQKENYLLLDVFKWKINDTETDGHYGMRQYNKFSYIHLKYVYDETNDRHIYYLDNDTYDNIDVVNQNELIINLYEAKVE